MQRRLAIGGEMKKPEAEVPARFPARPVLPTNAPLPDKHKTNAQTFICKCAHLPSQADPPDFGAASV